MIKLVLKIKRDQEFLIISRSIKALLQKNMPIIVSQSLAGMINIQEINLKISLHLTEHGLLQTAMEQE